MKPLTATQILDRELAAIPDNVARGILFLNVNADNWRGRVLASFLAMQRCESCMLGQAFCDWTPEQFPDAGMPRDGYWRVVYGSEYDRPEKFFRLLNGVEASHLGFRIPTCLDQWPLEKAFGPVEAYMADVFCPYYSALTAEWKRILRDPEYKE